MTTFTDGYGGDVSTYIDTYIERGAADTNYATTVYLQISSEATPTNVTLLKFDVSGIPDGATINSATLYLYQHQWGSGAYTGDIHRILAANSGWTEVGATWNHSVGTTHWAGDAGGDHGNDAGCCVSGTDYDATVVGTLTGNGTNATGTEYAITLDVDEVKELLTADYGLVLIATSGTSQFICSSDHTTTGYRPKLVIDYTDGSTSTPKTLTGGDTPTGTLVKQTQKFFTGG